MNRIAKPVNMCRNLNHGRSGVSICYCPECGNKFDSVKSVMCGGQKHAAYRKQRFNFCLDCGSRLNAALHK